MKDTLNGFSQSVGFSLAGWVAPSAPQPVVLEGRDVVIKHVDVARDAKALFAAFNAPDGEQNWTYLPYGPFKTLSAFKGWLQSSCTGSDPMFYTIVDRKTDAAVGLASYLRIDPANGVIEVGHIHMAPALQRTRCATEAMILMMGYAFQLGYRRYEWKCDALNAPSRQAALRLGFSYNGTFPWATMYKGRNRDTAWYAVIGADWPTLNAAFTTWLDPQNFDENGNQKLRLSDLTAGIGNR